MQVRLTVSPVLMALLVAGAIVVSCSGSFHEDPLLKFVDKEDVHLTLASLGWDSVQPDINRLKKVRTLVVARHPMKTWVIYPPPEKMSFWVESPPFAILPNELTELTTLEQLTLHKLNVKTLPDDFADYITWSTSNFQGTNLRSQGRFRNCRRSKDCDTSVWWVTRWIRPICELFNWHYPSHILIINCP
jgi:hypothetical protein